jgi:hypothetical protein
MTIVLDVIVLLVLINFAESILRDNSTAQQNLDGLRHIKDIGASNDQGEHGLNPMGIFDKGVQEQITASDDGAQR